MIGMTDVALLDWLGRTLHASEGQSREDSQEAMQRVSMPKPMPHSWR